MTALNGPILFNSSTGSDSLASGLGPSTAVNSTTEGTTASYSGTTITFSGATDLSGVSAGDLLYLATSTGRKFFAIASVNDGADSLTVDNTPTGTASGLSWAIGGVRQYIASATSKVLVDQGGSSGDAHLKGWTLQMADGHAETISATLDVRCAADTTNGPFRLIGESGATTPPLLTFSNNGKAIMMRGNGQHYVDFEVQNSNATKTASVAVTTGSAGAYNILRGITVADGTNNFWKGFMFTSSDPVVVEQCHVANCASDGITAIWSGGFRIASSNIHDNGGSGIVTSGTGSNLQLLNNLIHANTGNGLSDSTAGASGVGCYTIRGNSFYSNGGDGIDFSGTGTREIAGLRIDANIFILNGGFGIDLNVGSTVAYYDSYGVLVSNNAFGSGSVANTSGVIDPSGLDQDSITLTADPFVNAASGDFNINDTAGGGASLRAATLTMPG